MELTGLIVNGNFYPGLKVGQAKSVVEAVLGIRLSCPDIQTEDVNYYEIEMKAGVCLIIVFDKADVCFEIRLDLDKNRDVDFIINENDIIKAFDASISFDSLICILMQLNVAWTFDKEKTYLQTVCIHLSNGLRLYYAFGDESNGDYGFFSIKSVLEGHYLT
ncbi:hypothetical protein [Chitinophaga filiformis]|uniref:Immunity protein 50 n=1 Tax=Chitinophaga filiformis TaxID=104663 RepID=A0ABY4HVS8_CHIFI|nr:hypothetical protein [Chitinophaga filiformis]UPK67896.1 hypothetical protein MYF79_23370 [Chitinophaga filiformis]